VEYLLVVAAVILGIIAVSSALQSGVSSLGTEAKTQIEESPDKLGEITLGAR
jgi:Flp pilus assembly pilin Flp